MLYNVPYCSRARIQKLGSRSSIHERNKYMLNNRQSSIHGMSGPSYEKQCFHQWFVFRDAIKNGDKKTQSRTARTPRHLPGRTCNAWISKSSFAEMYNTVRSMSQLGPLLIHFGVFDPIIYSLYEHVRLKLDIMVSQTLRLTSLMLRSNLLKKIPYSIPKHSVKLLKYS